MPRFAVRRKDTGTYLTEEGAWSDDLTEARLFRNKGAGTNSFRVAMGASAFRSARRINYSTMPEMEHVEVEIVEAGKPHPRDANDVELMQALYVCGVDNWEGYSEAVRTVAEGEG